MNNGAITKMRVECAWCGKHMGDKDGYGEEGTSHGICSECLEIAFRETRKYLRPES